MRLRGSTLSLTPTDIAVHLACRHLTQLDRARVEGRLRVELHQDPHLDALRRRGERHEQDYVRSLEEDGRSVRDLRASDDPAETLKAMRDGTDVIVQPPLGAGRFAGRADLLLRVDTPSALGAHSYEPADTKLARDTRGASILQLCTYAVMLAPAQALEPERFHVVTPAGRETYRTADFDAYFRFVRARLEGAVDANPPPDTYPEPVGQCDICSLWAHCNRRRRADDHLSLVAGIRTTNLRELQRQGVATVAALAATNGNLPAPPSRGARDTYVRLAHQARLQVAARTRDLPPVELLDCEPDRGLGRLPEPSPGDVFLDFEGDVFVADGGLEYLTGWTFRGDDGAWAYEHRWALARAQERAACEAFLDFVAARLAAHPGLHVYHFGIYEPGALKRVVSRHATRAETLDRLLRGGRFVDLHAVVREGFRIGVERYGLKELEPLVGFGRTLDLRQAGAARLAVELGLEMGDGDAATAETRATVAAYNREDCLSTAALRDWLEARRAEALRQGRTIPRPVVPDGDASEAIKERDLRIQATADALLAGVPAEPADRTDDEQARWLLAQMLGYFRREEKCAWWEHFRLRELPAEDLIDEREVVAGLEFVEALPLRPRQRVPVHRYRFPPQETALEEGKKVYAVSIDDPDGGMFGTVAAIDLGAGTIDVKKTARTAAMHPSALFRDQVVPAGALEDALLAFGDAVRAKGLDTRADFGAASDLLCRRPPRRRARTGAALRRAGEDLLAAAVRLCGELDGGVLPIQGPPGSGKTYTGARAIVALVAKGKRVGVTAVSHKVIDNLLEEVRDAAAEAGVTVHLVHKAEDGTAPPGIVEMDDNDAALGAIAPGVVVGGTAWLWARDDARQALDHLFVDEAGQMALPQVLAASRAARNLVLLGDPQQLEQPRKGAHPEGTDVAALVHAIGPGRATLTDAQGLFLDRTWRLHPALCKFTSGAYYDDRLEPVPGRDRQALLGPTPFAGSGPFLVEVAHEGNQASAPEEAEAVARIVAALLAPGVRWRGATDKPRAIRPDDVLVVAPYNAQVALLRRRLQPLGVTRVGTVDKFQGQEAAVVVYSCTSSSAEDAPRGMDFLYDPHRFNVATSRARGVAVVVASPRVFEAECRTPEQMRKVNGLCRFRELARVEAAPAS